MLDILFQLTVYYTTNDNIFVICEGFFICFQITYYDILLIKNYDGYKCVPVLTYFDYQINLAVS